MRIAGIIGGVGPESTIDYYRQLVDSFRERSPEKAYPRLIINSVDLSRMVAMITSNRLDDVADYLSGEIQRLVDAGADFALLSANTPHVVFERLEARATIPLISIVEVTCAEAVAHGMKRVALFGTRFTMQGEFYPRVFSKRGIELVIPTVEEIALIHDRYMNELVNGIFRDETRDLLWSIARRMQKDDSIEAVILGGTELPLIMKASDADIPVLDTTRIHVAAIVDELLR